MKSVWRAVIVGCLGCGPATPTSVAPSPAIAIVPLELVVDRDVPVRRVELRADGTITIDGERRANVQGATIRGDAGVITLHADGHVTALRANDQAPALSLAFGKDDDLLAPSGEGIHIDPAGKVWNSSRENYAKSDAHFLQLPAGSRRTAGLLVLSLMLFTPKPLER